MDEPIDLVEKIDDELSKFTTLRKDVLRDNSIAYDHIRIELDDAVGMDRIREVARCRIEKWDDT